MVDRQNERELNSLFAEFKEAAERGEAEGQFYLGLCYYLGKGTKIDFSQAVDFFARAAAQGHARAQYYMGESSFYGGGGTFDIKKAAYWFQKAAEQGDIQAQIKIGDCYRDGDGVEKDLYRAAYWYKKALDQGGKEARPKLAECCNNIGLMLLEQNGDRQDQEKALAFFLHALQLGDEKALAGLTKYYNKFKSEKARRILADYYYNFGEDLYKRDNKKKDVDKTIQLLQKAKNYGNDKADALLIDCYNYKGSAHYETNAYTYDVDEAIKWFRKAAKLGDAKAKKYLALSIRRKKDFEQSLDNSTDGPNHKIAFYLKLFFLTILILVLAFGPMIIKYFLYTHFESPFLAWLFYNGLSLLIVFILWLTWGRKSG